MSFLALWLGVGILGGLGSLSRFLVSRLVSAGVRGGFPLGTLAVNLSGTLVLGVLLGAAVRGDAYLLAGTATIGSYTTFSTWMFESEREGEAGRRAVVVLNLLGSLVLGLGAAWLGRRIGGG
jgi:fluoride exporter